MPPCSRCRKPSVIRLAYAGRDLCREHFLRLFDERAKAEVRRQGGLPDGTVAVALSGGKDSVALLHFLHGLAAERPRTRLVAVTVDEGIAGYRDQALEVCRAATERLGVDWQVVRTRDLAGYTIDGYAAGTGKDPTAIDPATGRHRPRPACGPCGVFRRYGVNRVARELGAAAVATGHNLDDTAQTILMNVLGGDPDRLARLAPHDEALGGLVRRIVPLRSIPEKEVLLFAVLHGLPVAQEEECPYAARANRFRLRDLLWKLEEEQPGTRHRLVAFQDKIRPALAARPGPPLAACAACGEPASGDVCMACRWKATPAIS